MRHHPFMLPSALLLDMDGTITEPMLDFPRIKREMGIGEVPILEALSRLDPAERAKAEAVLHRHEERAASGSRLNAGCIELLDWCQQHDLPVAVITRNSRRSVDAVLLKHSLRIDVSITRDDGVFKPDPRPLRLACEKLGAALDAAWMVGDGVHDVEAGNAAGIKTVWLSHGRARSFAAVPWLTVPDLHELLNVLRRAVSNP